MSFLATPNAIASKITLQHFSIGGFTLDAVVEEGFEVSATLSESAVESGARVSDHKVKNPRAGVIRGIIVNYEVSDGFSQLFPSVDAKLKELNLPIAISSSTDYIRATVNRFVAPVTKALNSGIPSFLNDSSSTDDRITKIKSTLEALCFSDDLLTVSTSGGEYTQVSLLAVSVVRVNDSAEVSLSFREVLTYDVETVKGINAVIKPQKKATAEATNKPQTENKADKAKQQSAKPQNKGKTQPQQSKKSAIVGGGEWAKKTFG